MKRYLWNLLIALDQFAGVAFAPLLNWACAAKAARFGDPDETISSVLGKLHKAGDGNRLARGLYRLLNRLESQHCETSVEADRGNRSL